jgi:hypothetical protein
VVAGAAAAGAGATATAASATVHSGDGAETLSSGQLAVERAGAGATSCVGADTAGGTAAAHTHRPARLLRRGSAVKVADVRVAMGTRHWRGARSVGNATS